MKACLMTSIVFDFDDTLFEMVPNMLPFANKMFQTGIRYEDCYTFNLSLLFGRTDDEIDHMFHQFCMSDDHKKMVPTPGMHKALQYVSSKYNAVHIATARKSKAEIALSMHNALVQHDMMKYMQRVFMGSSKGAVCKRVGAVAFVDDAPHNIEDVATDSPKTTRILVDRPWNQDYKEDVIRITSGYDILNIL